MSRSSERTDGPLPPTSYDDVPYESSSFPQTHPDRLATLATLFGLTPAPVEHCRVLELGCAMGANLVPMAFHLPASEFVGVDASVRQVTAARDTIADLGLANIRVEHASILDVGADWGHFDYVICHGVYSWVTEAVQDRILAIAGQNLAPDGVAFISYNTYPGWHMRGMIRDMMRYHTSQFSDIPDQIEQARALLDFLVGTVDTTTYYGALLQAELNIVHRARDSYLFHEHLEEVNEPVYFHEFVRRASSHGLRYLAEAEFTSMLASGFPAGTAETLARISPDIVRAEQYMDFLRNRLFRQTLLCHSHHHIRRQLAGRDLRGLLLASPVTPDESNGERAPGFNAPDGRRVATGFPLTHAALHVLSEHWPLALDQATLLARASERLDTRPESAVLERQWAVVLDDMLHCYASGTVELRTWQAPCVPRVTTTPSISRLAAQQARSGTSVANQRHEAISLDLLGKYLAPSLDGTRDRAALIARLTEGMANGESTLEHGRPMAHDAQPHEAIAAAVDETLSSFARRGLLVG